MKPSCAVDYLDHMIDAARLACSYLDDSDKKHFLADKRTNRRTHRPSA